MMILRRVTLFPYYDLGGGGGCGKFPMKMTSSMGERGNHSFPEKEKEMKILYAVRRSSFSCLLFHFDKMLIQN